MEAYQNAISVFWGGFFKGFFFVMFSSILWFFGIHWLYSPAVFLDKNNEAAEAKEK